MDYSKIFKKQGFLVVGSICLILIVLIGVSYAIFQKNLISENNLVVKAGDLEITFNEGTTISGELVPMTDDDGVESGSEYSFTVENTGTLDASFSIQIYADTLVSGTHIPHKYVKLSYDGGEAMRLSDLEKVTTGANESGNVYKVGSGSINSGTNQDHVIRLWVSNDAPTDIIGNVIAFKLKVVSEVKK